MADYDTAFNYMIANEDYAPNDPRYGKINTDNDGGAVRFGINSNGLGKNLIHTTFYTTMPIDLAFTVAKMLYNTAIWVPIHGSGIQAQRAASKLLDMSVNMGRRQAVKLAQRVVNTDVDGVIGPITLEAINKTDEDTMLTGLVGQWLWFIDQEIKNKPADEKYRKPWTARAIKLPQQDELPSNI